MSDTCQGCGAVRIVKHGYCKRCRMEAPIGHTSIAAEATA